MDKNLEKMKLFYFAILFGILNASPNVVAQILGDLINSAGTIIAGLGMQIGNIIPTADELANAPIQILFGLPEVAVLSIVNQLCSTYLAAGTINPRVKPDVNKISLRLRTPCEVYSFSLSEVENILDSPEFDINKKVVIFINGWLADSGMDTVIQLSEAFACRGDYNFIALDTADAIRTLYTWSSFNTDEIGSLLAKALEKLIVKVPPENIHLIGLSLGAHIAGYTGRYFTNYTGLSLSRITGLDPANPCFNEGESLSDLQRGDAAFVDIIHTNPGGFGKRDILGDVDFFAGGLAPIKPGCTILTCSHVRSLKYFTESVYPGNENNFLAVRCTSLAKVNDGFCTGPKYPMGLATPHNVSGNYFLPVNAESPYGQNSDGGDAVPSQCKKCET